MREYSPAKSLSLKSVDSQYVAIRYSKKPDFPAKIPFFASTGFNIHRSPKKSSRVGIDSSMMQE
jgi:hypothetical protein